jgi:hypothetical protein
MGLEFRTNWYIFIFYYCYIVILVFIYIKIISNPVQLIFLQSAAIQRISALQVNVVPLQCRCGPEVSRRFRLPDFLDIRHMKVARSSGARTGKFPPGSFLVLIWNRVWFEPRCCRKNIPLKNPLTPTGIYPTFVQLVAQRFKHYTSPGATLQGAENGILLYLHTVFCYVQYIFLESDASSISNRFESSCIYQYAILGNPKMFSYSFL